MCEKPLLTFTQNKYYVKSLYKKQKYKIILKFTIFEDCILIIIYNTYYYIM